MTYLKISEGFVTQRPPGTPTSAVAGARCARTAGGGIVCTFIAQSVLGSNDFKPMIARSRDGGETWSEPTLIWPELADRFSLFGSVSAAPSGELLFYGTQTLIDKPGESFWSEETQGLKANTLFWASSPDGGVTWSQPSPIPMPIPGSAEAPGAMSVLRGGGWVCCYSPYPTFDPAYKVETDRIMFLRSDNRGETWSHSIMLKFAEPDSVGAEAWVVELSDGCLLGAGWHVRKNAAPPDAYAVSRDGGATWSATRSTGIFGQSIALAPLEGGKAIFLYNQRKSQETGVWMALVKPTADDFGVQENQRIWSAAKPSQVAGLTDHANWTQFAFGEPAALVLPNNEVLITLWAAQRPGGDIVYVKLRLE